jgi:hypothetical protein
LKRYEAEGVQIDVKQDRLIEIRFFDACHRTYTSPSMVVPLTQLRKRTRLKGDVEDAPLLGR